MFIMLIDSCHLRGRSICFDENPSSDPRLVKVNSVGAFNLTSHRVVVCAKHYLVFSILAIVIDVIVAIATYVNGFKCIAERTKFL